MISHSSKDILVSEGVICIGEEPDDPSVIDTVAYNRGLYMVVARFKCGNSDEPGYSCSLAAYHPGQHAGYTSHSLAGTCVMRWPNHQDLDEPDIDIDPEDDGLAAWLSVDTESG